MDVKKETQKRNDMAIGKTLTESGIGISLAVVGGSLLVKDDSEHSVGSLGLMTQPRELYNPAPEGYKWVDQAKVGDIEWDLMAELNKKKL